MRYKINESNEIIRESRGRDGETIKMEIEIPIETYRYITKTPLDPRDNSGILTQTFKAIRRGTVIGNGNNEEVRRRA